MKKMKIFVVIIGVIIIYIIICQLTVFSIDTMVKNLFLTNEYDNRVSQEVYNKFLGVNEKVYEEENYNIDLKLKRIFAIHLFGNGYVWYRYTVKIEVNNQEYDSSHNVPYKVKIKLVDGHWNIVDSYENP